MSFEFWVYVLKGEGIRILKVSFTLFDDVFEMVFKFSFLILDSIRLIHNILEKSLSLAEAESLLWVCVKLDIVLYLCYFWRELFREALMDHANA